eukprot:GDKK01053955.1.p1 GENE.GDKK01053955.1~~GDKK01053955.1.p1  ORF type:complete len:892 (-),score=173.42 GDKK01053955.1:56-2731(-)
MFPSLLQFFGRKVRETQCMKEFEAMGVEISAELTVLGLLFVLSEESCSQMLFEMFTLDYPLLVMQAAIENGDTTFNMQMMFELVATSLCGTNCDFTVISQTEAALLKQSELHDCPSPVKYLSSKSASERACWDIISRIVFATRWSSITPTLKVFEKVIMHISECHTRGIELFTKPATDASGDSSSHPSVLVQLISSVLEIDSAYPRHDLKSLRCVLTPKTSDFLSFLTSTLQQFGLEAPLVYVLLMSGQWRVILSLLQSSLIKLHDDVESKKCPPITSVPPLFSLLKSVLIAAACSKNDTSNPYLPQMSFTTAVQAGLLAVPPKLTTANDYYRSLIDFSDGSIFSECLLATLPALSSLKPIQTTSHNSFDPCRNLVGLLCLSLSLGLFKQRKGKKRDPSDEEANKNRDEAETDAYENEDATGIMEGVARALPALSDRPHLAILLLKGLLGESGFGSGGLVVSIVDFVRLGAVQYGLMVDAWRRGRQTDMATVAESCGAVYGPPREFDVLLDDDVSLTSDYVTCQARSHSDPRTMDHPLLFLARLLKAPVNEEGLSFWKSTCVSTGYLPGVVLVLERASEIATAVELLKVEVTTLLDGLIQEIRSKKEELCVNSISSIRLFKWLIFPERLAGVPETLLTLFSHLNFCRGMFERNRVGLSEGVEGDFWISVLSDVLSVRSREMKADDHEAEALNECLKLIENLLFELGGTLLGRSRGVGVRLVSSVSVSDSRFLVARLLDAHRAVSGVRKAAEGVLQEDTFRLLTRRNKLLKSAIGKVSGGVQLAVLDSACLICGELLAFDDQNSTLHPLVTLPCGHVYHYKCCIVKEEGFDRSHLEEDEATKLANHFESLVRRGAGVGTAKARILSGGLTTGQEAKCNLCNVQTAVDSHFCE